MPLSLSNRLLRPRTPRTSGGGVTPTGQTALFMTLGDSNTSTGQNLPAVTPDPRVRAFRQSLNAGAGGLEVTTDPIEHLHKAAWGVTFTSLIGSGIAFGKLFTAQTGHNYVIVGAGKGGSGFASSDPQYDWNTATELPQFAIDRWKAAWDLITGPKFAGGFIISINTNNPGTADAPARTATLVSRLRAGLTAHGVSPSTPVVFVPVNPAWLDNPTQIPVTSRVYLPNGVFSSPARYCVDQIVKDAPNHIPYSATLDPAGFTFNQPFDYTHHDANCHINVIAPRLRPAFTAAALNAAPTGMKTRPLSHGVLELTLTNGVFRARAPSGNPWHNPAPSPSGWRFYKSPSPDMSGKTLAHTYTGPLLDVTYTPPTVDNLYYQAELWGTNGNGTNGYGSRQIVQHNGSLPVPGSFNIGVNLSGGERGTAIPGTRGTDWREPSAALVTEMSDKGFNTFRVPIKWERAQPTLNAALEDALYMDYFDTVIAQITALGKRTILDVHNYDRRRTTFSNPASETVIGQGSITLASFIDFWTRLATRYAANPLVMFGLMNEPTLAISTPPGDLTPVIITKYQQVINAIRASGARNRIIFPLYEFNNGRNAPVNDLAKVFREVNDPYQPLLYEVHQYGDADQNGGDDEPGNNPNDYDVLSSENRFTNRLLSVTALARAYGKKLLLGEIGIATSPEFLKGARTVMSYLHDNRDVWEFTTFWAAGDTVSDTYLYKLNDYTTSAEAPPTTLIKTLYNSGNPVFPYPGTSIDYRFGGVLGDQMFGTTSLAAITDFSRTSEAWQWDKGVLENVPAGNARINPDGILLEKPSENIMRSDSFVEDTGFTEIGLSLQKTGGGGTFFHPSPDGENKAARILEGTNALAKEAEFGFISTPAPNTTHAISAWFKSLGSDNLLESFFLWISASGALNNPSLSTTRLSKTFLSLQEGDWLRNSLLLTTNSQIKMRIGLNGTSTGGSALEPLAYTGSGRYCDMFALQIEPDARYPSSPILKYSADPAIRAGDVFTPKGSFLTLLQSNQFTLVMKVLDLPAFSEAVPLFLLNGIEALGMTNDHKVQGLFGAAQETNQFALFSDIESGSRYRKTPRNVAITVNRGTARIGIGGQSAGTSELAIGVPSVTSAAFGQSGGRIKRFAILPTYSTPAQLQTIIDNF